MSRDREREKKRDQEDEEEAYERRKLERKLRDKEAAYQEVGGMGYCSLCLMFWNLLVFACDLHDTVLTLQRLKNWELRERKKARDYAKDTEREDERRREMVRGLRDVLLNC